MKKLMVLPLVAAALLLGLPAPAPAQQAPPSAKPVAVVSISGYQELLDDIGYIGRVAGNPQAAQGVEGLIKLFTQGKGPVGLDKGRPWGVVMTRGSDLQGYAFIPVTDLKALLKVLVAFVGTPEDAGDGILELKYEEKPFYVKEQGGWAFLSGDPENLITLPEDPAKLLGDLPEQYDLAVRASPQNLPPQIRQLFLGQMRQAAVQGLQEPDPGETPEAFELRKQTVQATLDAFDTMASEIDNLTLGLAVDDEARKTYIDLTLSASEGSSLAQQLSAPAVETRFAGFNRPDALARLTTASEISAAEQPQALQAVEQVRAQLLAQIETEGQGNVAQLKEIANGFCDVMVATIETGRFDGGMAVVGDGPLTLLAGFHVGDSDKVSAGIRDLMDAARGQEGVSEIELDAATHQGVTFHSMVVSMPAPAPAEDDAPADGGKDAKDARDEPADDVPSREDQEQAAAEAARALFGEKVPVVFGVGADAAYFGMGQEALAELKKLIDDSAAATEKKIAPFEFSVRPALMIKAAAKANPDDFMLNAVSQNLPQNDQDQVKLIVMPVAGRMQMRLEIGEGVLPLFGVAASLAQQAGAGGTPGF